jgi:glycosyltransferase involved in cell wall biosynthesis
MALRLTGISLENQDPATGTPGALPRSGPALAAQLRAQAHAFLAAGRLDDYRALSTRAAEHDDPHARYWGRLVLIEEGLANAGRSNSSARTAQLFVAVADAALNLLEEDPREPTVLLYAGVAMYELWSLDAARALFLAAQRLDSSLPHLKQNLKQLKVRARSAGWGGRPLRPLHNSVPGLAGRAKRVATSAHPAKGLKLSLCMIVRDEEEMLERCLSAVAPAVDEIVIVDTGSQDRTIELARSFGARVIEREWTGSFSEARNVSFEAATGDWLMYLDADEVLVADDVDRLRALTGQVWREAFYLVETNYTGEIGDGAAVTNNALRIFRNRPQYRFEGRLHEQIAQHLPVHIPGRIEQTSVRIEHYGYLGAVRDAKEKSRRNLQLLRAQQQEGPPSAFLHFNLGSECAAIGDAAAAVSEFEHAWSMVKEGGEHDRDYVPSLVLRLVIALRTHGRAHEALEVAKEGLELFPGFTDLVFAQAQAWQSLGQPEHAIAAWKQCIEMGDAPARYGSAVGAGTYLPRIELAALYARRGELPPAREALDWCLREHPSFIGAVRPYATVSLRSGVSAEAVVEELETRIDPPTPAARFMLAGALYAHGAMASAEAQYRLVLAGRPHSSQVRAQLAETLLHQGRYGDAAEEASVIEGDDPFVPLACRIELWGRIAGGDLQGASAASLRATAANVPPAELEVFAAWLALAEGTTEPRHLPIAASPLLGVILETLLRARNFQAFETLLPLLKSSALPRREQRELLAGMYLANGFLALAAREWMAVCEADPDSRAFLGLARLAVIQGQLEEATVFASEALRLDPNCDAAMQILTRYAPTGSEVPVGQA